jgi:acetyl-CoA carboxylase carboxyltransferase component
MAGRSYDPAFLFMWPHARISVMGGEQAGNVLVTIKEEQEKAAGKSMSTHELLKLKESILHKYNEEGSAYYSSSRVWDDGIIDPADTRKILALCIEVTLHRTFDAPKSGIYRM